MHAEPEPVKSEPAVAGRRSARRHRGIAVANKATTLKKIETTGAGAAIEVRLATDGDVAYNAFKLEKPSRIVIDLTGVNDKLAKNIINVSDPVVKRIRVSQFKSAPEPSRASCSTSMRRPAITSRNQATRCTSPSAARRPSCAPARASARTEEGRAAVAATPPLRPS